MSDTYAVQCPGCGADDRIAQADTSRLQRCKNCQAPLIASNTLPLDVTDRDWKREVLDSRVPTIVVVWGENCGTCAEYESSVRLMAGSLYGEARILRLKIDDNPATAKHYDIHGVPTVLLFHEGQLTRTLSGPQGEQGLRSMLGLEAQVSTRSLAG